MSVLPRRVLIVDDEAPARSRMRDLLDDVNAALPVVVAGEAANGRDALQIVEAGTPEDILISPQNPRTQSFISAVRT